MEKMCYFSGIRASYCVGNVIRKELYVGTCCTILFNYVSYQKRYTKNSTPRLPTPAIDFLRQRQQRNEQVAIAAVAQLNFIS